MRRKVRSSTVDNVWGAICIAIGIAIGIATGTDNLDYAEGIWWYTTTHGGMQRHVLVYKSIWWYTTMHGGIQGMW